ncbi:unnamed protein product [Rotaria magnacalcarata]|uniref:Uncharacterized protein n=1 Tax=Rotaria magnacalcarata TaxID=392030 RepID=A0A816NDA9_9BILA|nr:unnamed protein product [Rotaria magnacalcarata]CAF4045598.1 unnamed protein product [Rotaria magnacalcarata]
MPMKKSRILACIICTGITLVFIRICGLSSYQLYQFINDENNYLTTQSSDKYESITLCVLVRVYSRYISYLPVIALALRQAGIPNIHIYVINIDKHVDTDLLSRTIDIINRISHRPGYIRLFSIGTPGDNDFGFPQTDLALTYLYNQHEHSPSVCQYVILTNGDNFYSQDLGNNILPHMVAKKDIIAWDFVSRYKRPDRIVEDQERKNFPLIIDAGTAKCLQVALKIGSIDLGAAAYRLAFLKQHNLQLHYPNGAYDELSDGYFAETAGNLTNASVILRQTLYVHQ